MDANANKTSLTQKKGSLPIGALSILNIFFFKGEKIMKKLSLVLSIVIVAVFGLNQEASAREDQEAFWIYFTQDKNISNLNTQTSAQKGLLEKAERGINSIGKHQKIAHAPNAYKKIGIEMYQKHDTLSIDYVILPPREFNNRISIHEQIFRESIAETHVYIVLPKYIFPILRKQRSIITSNNRQIEFLDMVSPETTNLSKILEKYNSITGNTQKSQENYSSSMERAFDGTLDLMGKSGKIAKFVKKFIKLGLEKGEKERVQYLREKYGSNYQVYRIPFHAFKKVNLKQINIGRANSISLYSSKKPVKEKMFIEIPRMTFEIDVKGAARKASIEGLAYEMMIKPEFVKITNIPTVVTKKKSKKFLHRDTLMNRNKFNEEVKKYVESGELFKSVYNNVGRILWFEKINDGKFLVAVEYKRGGGIQYCEVRSFYFPLPNDLEFISELKKIRGISYLSPKAIEEERLKAFGWIVFEQLRKHGNKGYIWGKGCAFKKNYNTGKYEWSFPHSPRSSLNAIAKEGIESYRRMSDKYRKSLLGEAEKICLTSPLKELSRDYRISMYKRIDNAIGNTVGIVATYILKGRNGTHMELRGDDTFLIKNRKTINGKYRIEASGIVFMVNNRTIRRNYGVEFVIGPEDNRWTRTD